MSRIAKLIVFLLLLNVSLVVPACAVSRAHKKAPVTQGQDVTVWVNLKTGVYHYRGSRWYGRTKVGEYLKESEARKEGFRPAENGQ